MSGPKFSEANLVRRQQQELARKRQLEIEEKRRQLNITKERCKNKIDELKAVRVAVKGLLSSEKINKQFSYQLERLLTEIDCLDFSLDGDIAQIERKITQFTSRIESVKVQVEDINHKNEEQKISVAISNATIQEEKSIYMGVFMDEIDFFSYEELLDEVRMTDDIFPEDKKTLLEKCVQFEAAFDSNFNNKTAKLRELNNLKEEISVRLFNAKKKYNQLSDLYSEYVLLVDMVGGVCEEINFFHNVSELKVKVDELTLMIAKQDELEYISASIEEVMQEFGHNIIKSDVLRKSPHLNDCILNDIYHYDEDSAINVMISEDGALMMEVVATGDTSDMSENEKQEAVNHMVEFCSQYPEIIQKLEAKGIVFKNREELSPQKEFAKKIIVENNAGKKTKRSRMQEERRRSHGRNSKSSYM